MKRLQILATLVSYMLPPLSLHKPRLAYGGRAMIATALTPLKTLLKAVARTTRNQTTRNQTARLGMCKKLALGYAAGKPNPLNPPRITDEK